MTRNNKTALVSGFLDYQDFGIKIGEMISLTNILLRVILLGQNNKGRNETSGNLDISFRKL